MRLRAFSERQSPNDVLAPDALADAEQLAEIVHQNANDLEAAYTLGWFYWYRHLVLPDNQVSDAFDAACQVLTPCFIAGVDHLPKRLLASLADEAIPTAHSWTDQAATMTDVDFVRATVALWRRILSSIPVDDPEHASYLANLALTLRIQYERTGNLKDLDVAVHTSAAAVAQIPDDYPERAGILSNLGHILFLRFGRAGNPEDIHEAIRVVRSAVSSALPDDPDRSTALAILGITLLTRFKLTSNPTDLDEAITVLREAVEATPSNNSDHFRYMANLSGALIEKFGYVGSQIDLDEAITIGQAAVAAAPTSGADRALCMSGLSAALCTRFNNTGARSDLDEATTMARAAIDAMPPDDFRRSVLYTQLGATLRTRFTQTGDLRDLTASIDNTQTAIALTPSDHINFPTLLHNLGSVLLTRFERLGAQVDLDDAIKTMRAAVRSTPADFTERAVMLSHLSAALRHWFERTGDTKVIDEAVDVGREAVTATTSNRAHRGMCLNNLGAALRTRFNHMDALADLGEAITAARKALHSLPTDHPDRAAMLSMLSGALDVRHKRTSSIADLDEAVAYGRLAVQTAAADHPARATFLTSLSICLAARFVLTGAVADLNEAVTFGHQALQAVPTDQSDRAMYMSNLAVTLGHRAERTGQDDDWDKAIAMGRAAVQATRPNVTDYAKRMVNLGLALCARGDEAGREEAIATFVNAAELASGTPSVRVHAVRLARSVAIRADAARMADPLEIAIRLLPEVASRRLDRSDQEYVLGRLGGLASDAAGAVLADETSTTNGPSAVQALRLLELGRGIMLSLALDTRSDLTDLRDRDPVLAARFIELRDRMDHMDSGLPIDSDATSSRGHQIEDRHQLAGAFNAIVAEIRTLEGFENFLLPPDPNELVRHAEAGPIVVINVSKFRSDAILVQQKGITSIPLPGLEKNEVTDHVRLFHETLSATSEPTANIDQTHRAHDTVKGVLGWLWDAVAKPVLEELGYHRTPEPGTTWPRIWWVVSGIMGLLPIHAAGYHNERCRSDDRPTVMDRVISSYTPTIRALGYARDRHTAAVDITKPALIVAMPTTPNQHGPLPSADREAHLVRSRLPSSTLLIEDLAAGTQLPTKEAVIAELRECSIAHFACHGSSDPREPSQSRLLLHDHDTDPLTIASLAPLKFDHARLAYLSACHTAFNPSVDLADEAIHLTTAFQLLGYPHVVGTLWQISDAWAARIADMFYTALTAHDNLADTNMTAVALHNAIRTTRNKLPDAPAIWAAYLHTGA